MLVTTGPETRVGHVWLTDFRCLREVDIELAMSAQDVGNAQESLDAKFEGTELTVAFNPVFLRDGVEAVDADEVALDTIDPLKPATLRAAGGDDFLYLLMPVRTS